MPQPIEELKSVRIEKLEQLKELGIDPYPASWEYFDSRMLNRALAGEELGTKVVAVGRIRATRGHGGIVFADIYDESGKIQLCFREDEFDPEGPWEFDKLNLLDLGDFVGVRGELFRTEAGELTILVEDLKLLSKTIRPLPSEWYGLKDKEERYRKRYLDLIMNPEVREVFRKRTKILKLLRKYLDNHGFMEVETPILQPLYGGASARPFVTYLEALDTDFYLRISDELYLKRLIVGGFEKVYEVSKDFRNEGIDRQHSPEFTQIEFYWAYADYEDLMDFTEKMLCSLIEKVCGSLEVEFGETILDFSQPWPRVTYRDLVLERTGIDIDKVKTERDLLSRIREEGLTVDLKGAVGYGAVLDSLYKEYCRPELIQPTFLIDHPAELMPLAKRKPNDPSKIQSIQLLVSGYELVKAYSELNDPQDQKERWEEQEGLAAKGLEEHEALDEDYIEALEYGMPPTAGWGLGIDRLTAVLTNQHSIRDVIFFPLMRPAK